MKLDADDIRELQPVISAVVREVLDAIRDQGDGTGRIGYREQEAAELLGVEQHVLAAARRRGSIRAVKCGRYILYSRAELVRFANGLPLEPSPAKQPRRSKGLRAIG